MPKGKIKPPEVPEKARFVMKDGPQAGYIGDFTLPAPDHLYVSVPPPEFAATPEEAGWRVGVYRLTKEKSSDDSINAVYAFGGPVR